MNYSIYKISGINEKSGREKSIKINAINEDVAIQAATENGIRDISKIEILPHEPATERQKEYAISLGISFPMDITKEDLSALISKKVDRDGEPNEGLLEYATNKSIFLSTLIGKTALYNRLFYQLSKYDRIAFFIYCIYRYISDDRHANLDTHPDKELFYSFADEVCEDERFLKSLDRYSGSNLKFFGTFTTSDRWSHTGGSVDTIAFKTARKYLIDHSLIKETDSYRSKTMKPTYYAAPRVVQAAQVEPVTTFVEEIPFDSPMEESKTAAAIPKYELPTVVTILVLLTLYIFI